MHAVAAEGRSRETLESQGPIVTRLVAWDAMHFVMVQRMLRGVKERAEQQPLVPPVLLALARVGWLIGGAGVLALFVLHRRWLPGWASRHPPASHRRRAEWRSRLKATDAGMPRLSAHQETRRYTMSVSCSARYARGLLPGVALAMALPAAYTLFVRPRQLHWGATDEEAQQRLPGDDLVVGASYRSTRAIGIDAAAGGVWPWLVQMGSGRGGLYTYDRLERLIGVNLRNADVVVPELQHLAVGDTLPLWQNAAQRVAVLDSERALVLHDIMDLRTGRPPDPAISAEFSMEWTWAFVLYPMGARGTRLLVRTRANIRPRPLALTAPLWLEPVHFLMERGMRNVIRHQATRGSRCDGGSVCGVTPSSKRASKSLTSRISAT